MLFPNKLNRLRDILRSAGILAPVIGRFFGSTSSTWGSTTTRFGDN